MSVVVIVLVKFLPVMWWISRVLSKFPHFNYWLGWNFTDAMIWDEGVPKRHIGYDNQVFPYFSTLLIHSLSRSMLSGTVSTWMLLVRLVFPIVLDASPSSAKQASSWILLNNFCRNFYMRSHLLCFVSVVFYTIWNLARIISNWPSICFS